MHTLTPKNIAKPRVMKKKEGAVITDRKKGGKIRKMGVVITDRKGKWEGHYNKTNMNKNLLQSIIVLNGN